MLTGRAERLQERILELLEDINPEGARHSGPHGTAEFSTRPITQVNLEFLKREHPEVAQRAITKQLSRERLVAALRDWGADPSTTAKVLAEVFVPTGGIGPARVILSPNYALFYQGKQQGVDPEKLSAED